MTSELMSLTLVTALTAVMWIPYILNMIVVRGVMEGDAGDSEPCQRNSGISPDTQKVVIGDK